MAFGDKKKMSPEEQSEKIRQLRQSSSNIVKETKLGTPSEAMKIDVPEKEEVKPFTLPNKELRSRQVVSKVYPSVWEVFQELAANNPEVRSTNDLLNNILLDYVKKNKI